MNWINKSVDMGQLKQLSDRYQVDLLTCSILAKRNIVDRNEVKYYLENDLLFLHSPFEFEDMANAIERLNEAIESEEKIRIFGDKDVDGVTSTVLLINELKRLGVDVSYSVPDGEDSYGITKEKVQKAKEDGVSLFITVDCGISEVDEIKYANDLYIDTIVLDHHISGEVIPEAYAIIDPKKAGSTYPFQHLAGCGVVAKFIWALRFSDTEYFNEDYILLHSRPGNNSIIISAIKVRNLVEIDRITEIINLDIPHIDYTKIINFINCGIPIIVLDEEVEKKQLSKAFNSKFDIYLHDMRPILNKVFPSLKNKSLFALTKFSKSGKYSEFVKDEIDVLMGMFNSLIFASNELLNSKFDEILDLVAIGTISDLMDIVDENRILIKRGLKQLSNNPRRSLLPLLSNSKLLNTDITPKNVSWNISPYINSPGRLGKAPIAIEYLLATNDDEILSYTNKILELNKERKKIGEDIWKTIQNEAKESYERYASKLVVAKKSRIPKGITGLVSNKLLKQFGCTAMFLCKNNDSTYTGSMRSIGNFHIPNFLKNFEPLLLNFGGHANAGGFEIYEKNLKTLLDGIEELLFTMDEEDEENKNDLYIDCKIRENDFSPNLMNLVEVLQPYGNGNSPIIFQIDKATVKSFYFINGGTEENKNVKLSISYNNYVWPCVFFGGGRIFKNEIKEGDLADIALIMEYNTYEYQKKIQLRILDMKKSK